MILRHSNIRALLLTTIIVGATSGRLAWAQMFEPGLQLQKPAAKSKLTFAKTDSKKMIFVQGTIDTGVNKWIPTLVRVAIKPKNQYRFEIASKGIRPEMKDGKLQFAVDMEMNIKKGLYNVEVVMMAEVPKGQKDAGKLLRSKPVKTEFEILEK